MDIFKNEHFELVLFVRIDRKNEQYETWPVRAVYILFNINIVNNYY